MTNNALLDYQMPKVNKIMRFDNNYELDLKIQQLCIQKIADEKLLLRSMPP